MPGEPNLFLAAGCPAPWSNRRGMGSLPIAFANTKMNRFQAKYFKVVSHPEGRYAVWFDDAPRQEPWQETGQRGSEDECWDYVESAESSQGFWLHFEWGSR